MSPRRSRGARRRRTQVMNAILFMARHFVLNTSHPLRRIAPTSVRLSPQFIGRGSTYSSPRGPHTCDQPMARFAPASSRNTRRFGSCRRCHFRNASRWATTSGRSISLGRGRFLVHKALAPQRAVEARRGRSVGPSQAPVVFRTHLRHRGIGDLPDQDAQDRDINRGAPTTAAQRWFDGLGYAPPSVPTSAGSQRRGPPRAHTSPRRARTDDSTENRE